MGDRDLEDNHIVHTPTPQQALGVLSSLAELWTERLNAFTTDDLRTEDGLTEYDNLAFRLKMIGAWFREGMSPELIFERLLGLMWEDYPPRPTRLMDLGGLDQLSDTSASDRDALERMSPFAFSRCVPSMVNRILSDMPPIGLFSITRARIDEIFGGTGFIERT
ncbi:hypothetical protein HOG17_02840 [Candidatus Peregrinibacteria bacterium]|nr:hypothetical protein [Candidatus Peregrinibacteria bacterium]MBT4366492.1 hypothetical protein [Candidatus Peregrinibacteria bacterium]